MLFKINISRNSPIFKLKNIELVWNSQKKNCKKNLEKKFNFEKLICLKFAKKKILKNSLNIAKNMRLKGKKIKIARKSSIFLNKI
jgi:hypothetical protein